MRVRSIAAPLFFAQTAILVALALATILLGGCGNSVGSSSAQVLKIGIIPYDSPTKLQEQYTPFAQYLAGKCGRTAKVFVAQDYVGVAEALHADQIDCAYLNPLSYVLFDNRLKDTPERLIPLGMPEVHGSLYYYGVIVTRKETGITSIAQLKGKKMAFSEPTSTSGYLYPYQYLRDHGINPEKDFKDKIFASTPAVIPAVLNGTVDAGAVFAEGVTMFANPQQQKDLVILARVGPIANGMLVARGNLDPAVVAKLKSALAGINTDPAAAASLKALQVTKWDAPDDSVFDPVRTSASILGLNIATLGKKKS
jgi:phosphonate transport system substrate-binding protein